MSYSEVLDHSQAAKWLVRAHPGEICVYHVGRLAEARENVKSVHRLAEFLLMCAEIGCVLLGQQLLPLGARIYTATRSHRRVPHIVANALIAPETIRAACCVYMRPEHISINRHVAKHLGVPETHAGKLIERAVALGLVNHDHAGGATLTRKGRNLVVA